MEGGGSRTIAQFVRITHLKPCLAGRHPAHACMGKLSAPSSLFSLATIHASLPFNLFLTLARVRECARTIAQFVRITPLKPCLAGRHPAHACITSA